LIWDVTGDGYVGVEDIVAISARFGSQSGDPDWDPIFDINKDGYVGIDDIVEVAEHFGESS
jgi:Ca2+-binding EF-hand superfamily protein